MRRLWWKPNLDPDTHAQNGNQESPEERDQGVSDAKSWEEIGSEFRMMVYDIIHRFRQEINKKQ
jgi:hypothetical protein